MTLPSTDGAVSDAHDQCPLNNTLHVMRYTAFLAVDLTGEFQPPTPKARPYQDCHASLG